MMRLLLKILVLVSVSSFGQSGQIVGHVAMTDKVFGPNYLSVILTLDSVELIATVPDSNGDFRLDKISNGTYNLVIRQIGNRDAITKGLMITGDTLVYLNLVYPPPCNIITDKKPHCIDGHTDKIIPIVYGLPSKRTMKKSNKGKVYLAGCNLTGCDPLFYCTIHKKKL